MKQPEALRLAINLNCEGTTEEDMYNAAAELRRLYKANQAMLEALKELVNGYGFAPGHSIEKARAAIAKGEQA